MEVGYPVGVPPQDGLPQDYPQGPELVELSTPVDEDSWRYSRFALPWLLWCFLWLLGLFCLTFWQQAGDIKRLYDGIPRVVQVNDADHLHEGGQPKQLRNIRVASSFFGFFAILVAFAVFFARPNFTMRRVFNGVGAVFLIICCVLAWIAFGVGLGNFEKQEQCPNLRRWTMQKCMKHTAWAITAIALDAGVGMFSLISAILLLYNTFAANHWKLAPRDWEEAQADTTEPVKERIPGEQPQRNVGYVRKWLTGLALLATLACITALLVFVVLLHEDREKDRIYGPRGRTDYNGAYYTPRVYENAGWPTANTRIRYSVVGIGLLTILFNFLPFRSRTVAYIFAFLYLSVVVIALVAFGFDVVETRKADSKHMGCPRAYDNVDQTCSQGSFQATCVLDFVVAFFLLVYVLVEYVFLGKKQCQHCDRAFEMSDLMKHETSECLARPVRCEVCAKAMTFKQFNQHREFCSVDHTRCKNCGHMVPKWAVKSHQEECACWPVHCTMCDASLQRHDMPHHVMVCPNRPTACDACGETFRSRDMEAHQAVCAEVLVQCDLCEYHMQRFRLHQHQQCDCPKRLLECDRCGNMVPMFRWERHQQTCL